jgi:hypothetical protein
MKYPFVIQVGTIFIFLLISKFSFTQSIQETSNNLDSIPNHEKHILLGIGAGYRLNIDSNPDLNSNGFWGLSIDIPITYNLSVSSGIGFWNSSANYGLIVRDYSIIDIPLLLTYTSDMAGKGLDIFIGSGLLKVSDQSDKLITLNLGTSGWYELSHSFRIILCIKLQKASSLQAGGGNSITSIYLGSGIKVQIN